MRFEIDRYQAQGPNCVALLAIASLCAELAYDEKLDFNYFLKRLSGSKSQPLARYLDPTSSRPPQIRKENAGEEYAAKFIEQVFKELRSDEYAVKAGKGKVPGIFKSLPNLASTEPASVPKSGQVSIFSLLRMDTLGELIGAVCADLKIVDHPSLPCRAFSEPSIKCRLFGLQHDDLDTQPNTGLFAIIREARGHRAQNAGDRNIVVRDALFVKQSESDEQVGFYYSAIDASAFSIKRHAPPRSEKITLSGRIVVEEFGKLEAGAHTIKVDFRQRFNNFPLQYREALVSGETRQRNRAAAWKALMIRPQWHDLNDLETAIATVDNAVETGRYLMAQNVIGVLFQRQSGAESEELLALMETRRRAFRELIHTSTPKEQQFRLTDKDREYFEGEFAELWPRVRKLGAEGGNQRGKAAKFSEILVDRLERLVTNYWPYLEPAQIMVRKDERFHQRSSSLAKDEREKLELLTSLHDIIPYVRRR